MTAQPQFQPPTPPTPGATVHPMSPFPRFEGQTVHGTEIRISGLSKVDAADNVVVTTDDIVRLIGEFKCVGIRHEVNKDGELIRVQMMKPLNVDTAPWNPADPKDDGVQRARVIPGWKP